MQTLIKLKAAFQLQQQPCILKINDLTGNPVAMTIIVNGKQPITAGFTYQPTNTKTDHLFNNPPHCEHKSASCNMKICEYSKWMNYSSKLKSKINDKHKVFRCLPTEEISLNSTGWKISSLLANKKIAMLLEGYHFVRSRRQSNISFKSRTSVRNLNVLKRTFTTSSLLAFNSVDELQVPSLTDMKRHLKSSGMDFKMGHACLIGECPFCSHTDKQRRSKDEKKMFINMTTGMYLSVVLVGDCY